MQSFNSSCGSQVLLTSVSWTIGAGQTARLRAIVGGVTPLTPLPRGTVTFREGATVLGTSDVDANGVAMLDHAGFAIGNHTLTADFSGNAWLGSAQSNSFVQRVFAWSTSTTMTICASTHGEPFQSTVVPHDDLNNQNTAGWCYLTVDGVTEPYKRNTNFPITLTLNAGPHTMSAEFLGGYVPPSTSPTYSFTTAKHAVYVAKTGDTTKRAGTAHSIQITVTATTAPVPTGTVDFFCDTMSLGSVALSGGVASLTTTIPRGSYDCRAIYTGDANYLNGSNAFTLNALADAPLAIDARALATSSLAIDAVFPDNASSLTMYRRVHGTEAWSVVTSWTQFWQRDDGPLTRGVLYDYRLDAVVSGNTISSNIDSALLFNDPILAVGNTVKRIHFTELRDAINALRASAGLAPFAFDSTFSLPIVRAAHLIEMRDAVAEARQTLGMAPMTFLEPAPAGVTIKRVHLDELRNAVD